MIATAAFSWGFSLWFAALGVMSLVGLARAGRSPDGVSYAAHAIMSGVMAFMPWGWSAVVPQVVWIAVFGAFGLWYLSIAISRPGSRVAPGSGHHAAGTLLGYHAAMMGAMVWMSVLMILMPHGVAGTSTASHHGLAMDGMAGVGGALAPASGADASALAADPAGVLWQPPAWAIAVTVLFIALFAAATVWFVVRLGTLRRRRDLGIHEHTRDGVGARHGRRTSLAPVAEATLSLAMAIGMGASFIAML